MTKKEEIYNYIKSYIAEHGYAPSYREIGTAVNLKSTSSVYAHMQSFADLQQCQMVLIKQLLLEISAKK